MGPRGVSHEWQHERQELHRRLKAARDGIEQVLSDVSWDSFDLCDCGHRRTDHKRFVFKNVVHDACVVLGCPCVDFDDGERQHKHHVATLRALEGGAA